MKYLAKLLIFVSLPFLASSCGNDLTTGGVQYYRTGKGVFVCNEGNYMYGNASLSYYNPATGEVDGEIFYNANNFPLGDVCMSMNIIGERGYVVVNNSGKIYVIDINTFKYLGVITGLTSPRNIMKVGEGKMYVTNLYSPEISIIDEETLQKTGTIALPATSSEKMVIHDGYVYVCAYVGGDKIFKIDPEKDEIISSLTVTKQPNSMAVDNNGALWVLCNGGYHGSPTGEELAALIRVNTERFAVEKVYNFPSMDMSPFALCANDAGDSLYYINKSVYKMAVNDTSLPSEVFINGENNLFYALGVDVKTGEVYVSDAINYVQNGAVYRYSGAGRLMETFKVGINPSSFCFKN